PLAPPPPAGSVAPASVLVWEGPVRTDAQRAIAQARASARSAPGALPRSLSSARTSAPPPAPPRRRKTPA
ncbi:MAG TPA: hypothetical protein VN811_01125, partial [Thermoanaerobaculia bacterium]|nr:hypothetical protein [Thermoanaerobaculia bacterium]